MFVCPSCGVSAPGPAFCADDGAQLLDASDDPLLGTTVNVYRLARRLGRGGMGTVYLGVHPAIGSRVAVKVLLPVAAESQDLVDRFFSEARAVNLIKHESIVNVLDLSTLPDGRPYIVMEYLDGQPLSRCFASWRPFPLDLLVRLTLEILGALDAAHAAGIVHRDLKPDNVFVTSLSRAKVLDFGIAKLRPDQTRSETRAGSLLGTPHYMSPEQVRTENVDARADLYSLGVMLFEGATGRLPFDAPALFDILQKHMTELPPQPSLIRPDIPERLEQVIGRALAKRREDRFQSARELADALMPLVRELPESGSIPPLGPRYVSAPPTASSPTFVQASQAPRFTPGPTMNAVASHAEAPRARGFPYGIVLGIGAVLIALAALGVASAGTIVAFVMPHRGSKGSVSAASATATPALSRPKGDRFDPWDFLPKARERAKKKLPDAELYMVLVNGVDRDGLMTFDDMRNSVVYYFRSASASKQQCLMTVAVTKNGTFDNQSDSNNCLEPILPKLRCTIGQVAKRTPEGELLSISIQDRNGVAKWTIAMKDGTFMQQNDDC